MDLTGLDDAFRAGTRPAAGSVPAGHGQPAWCARQRRGQQRRWLAAEIPAVNGHGTAAAVAGFYHALSTGSLLGPEMLAEAVTLQCAGPDRVFGEDNAWGRGFGISDDGYGRAAWAETTAALARPATTRSDS